MSNGCSNCMYFRTVNFPCFIGLVFCCKLQPKQQQVLHSCFQGLTPKTKPFLWLQNLKKPKTKIKPTNKKNKKKWRKKKTTHQVLALITDKTLRYFGLQDKSLKQLMTVLRTRHKLVSKTAWVSVLPKLSCELKRSLLWIIISWPLLLPGRISSPLSRGAWQVGLPYRWILVLTAFGSLQDRIVYLSICKDWQLLWSLTKRTGEADVRFWR